MLSTISSWAWKNPAVMANVVDRRRVSGLGVAQGESQFILELAIAGFNHDDSSGT